MNEVKMNLMRYNFSCSIFALAMNTIFPEYHVNFFCFGKAIDLLKS